MRRLFAVAALAVVGFVALPAGPVSAHPLGNFSVNRYAGLSLYADRVDAVAVADIAELPTLQEPPATCAEAAGALAVAVDGVRLPWTVSAESLVFVDGAGGLKTSRLECGLTAPADLDRPASVTVENRFRDDRIGWHELVAVGSGVRLVDSPLPAAGVSDELRSYPDDLLASPPDVRSAVLTVEPGASAAAVGAAPVGTSAGWSLVASAEQRLTDLVGDRTLTPLVGTLAVLLALVLGAAHAALPGHGKTVMAAYLAGRQGRARDAVAVGATVTLTHTGGVLALGLLLTAAAGVAGEAVLGWLGLASGALVVAVGAGALRSALRGRRAASVHAHGHAPHDHRNVRNNGPTRGREGPRFRTLRGSWRSPRHEHEAHENGELGHAHGGYGQAPGGPGHAPGGDAHDRAHDAPGPARAHAPHDHRSVRNIGATRLREGPRFGTLRGSWRNPRRGHGHGPGAHEHGHTRVNAHDGHEHTHGAHGHGHDHHGHGLTHGGHGPGAHGHHHHGPGHRHGPGVSRWSIAGLGVAGGLVPSPSALVVLLGAIALGRTAFGIVLVLAYGLGMAATLTAAGLLLIRLRDRYAARFAGRFADRVGRRWRRLAPSATGALVVVVGLGLAGRALAGLA